MPSKHPSDIKIIETTDSTKQWESQNGKLKKARWFLFYSYEFFGKSEDVTWYLQDSQFSLKILKTIAKKNELLLKR